MSIKEPKSAFERTTQVGSSRPASVFSSQSIDTLVTNQGYRGFPSEQAYLDALKAWAQDKMMYEADEVLSGFYGKNTVDDVLAKQGTSRNARKSTRDRRRASIAPQLGTVIEHNGSASALSRHNSATPADDTTNEGKGNRLKRVFSRRKTIV